MDDYLLPSPHSISIPLPNVSVPCTEQEEIRLVTASRAGDHDAFAQLVQLHQRRVFNLVYRMLQNYEETNEVTQDTFLAAWQGLPTFRGEARFSTWVYRIAYNCCLKQLEQRKREKALQAAMQEEQILLHENSDTKMSSEIDAQESRDLIREFLAQLPAKYRVVLILRHLHDMTYEEMAEILTVPIGTIKTHLFRARNLLKERLEVFEREWKARG
jgi:RNA polymerase sigma-70 factor (ECF subfamily)